MTAKKIIACLDMQKGRVVKGVQFVDIQTVGDPVELAQAYSAAGMDELVLLDIDATKEGRGTLLEVVRRTAAAATVPFAVGGGVRSLADVTALLEAGADKVGINSAAVARPELIREVVERYGSERLVLAIDGKTMPDGSWHVMVAGGGVDSGRDLIEWAKEGEALGAGAILLTSVDADGERTGFDLPMTRAVKEAVTIPVIASGGAGSKEDFLEVFQTTDCDAALGASVFHYGLVPPAELRAYLKSEGVTLA